MQTTNNVNEIESKILNEKYYIHKLDNGLEVIIYPKKNTKNKYVIWMTKYGSNTSKFIDPITNEQVQVPDGVAHYLEHKMFEQENGTNSLDNLTTIGVSANAYTCSTHTAYLFEGIDNFDEALKELMDYVQHPYFTPENVEKERGIISQEIGMYDDEPFWKTYYSLLSIMYKNHPIKIDTAGTVESISKITDETLYKCYNTFYTPNNMKLILVGDIEENVLEKIKENITQNYSSRKTKDVKTIIQEEPDQIQSKEIINHMAISVPLFIIGLKLKPNEKLNITDPKQKQKREIAIRIINEILVGDISELYNELYQDNKIFEPIGSDIDYSDDYGFVIYSSYSKDPNYVFEQLKVKIEKLKKEKIDEKLFNTIKKSIYSDEIRSFEDVKSIARNLTNSQITNTNIYDYIENIKDISLDDINCVLDNDFVLENLAISITNPNK